jgi:predicted O-linked N-acetylglucosamine transferase (SPINDLY family)
LAETAVRQGDADGALALYGKILELEPRHAVAHYKRGNLFKDRMQPAAALADYDRAIALDPAYANAYCNRGAVLESLDRPQEALMSYDRAVELSPDDALTWYNRGSVLVRLNRPTEALASYDRAIALDPGNYPAYCNRGILLAELGQPDAALASYDQCIAADPHFVPAHFSRAVLLQSRKQFDRALEGYDRALELNPGHAEAHCNRGGLLTHLGRYDEALSSLDAAIALRTDLAEAFGNRGVLFAVVGQHAAALENYERALALKPDHADAIRNRAEALTYLKRLPEAVAGFDQAMRLKPTLRFLAGMRRHAMMQLCDWAGFDADVGQLTAGVADDEPVSPPFQLLALVDDVQLHHQAARLFVREECPVNRSLPNLATHPAGERIRVGYFSADFHEHPVTMLLAGVFEQHDPARFEVTAFSFGRESQSAVRQRLVRAFSRFIDVQRKSDMEIALLARELQIDIAVDLGGHTANSRPRIFALRAAPVQVNYLGYPGTSGAPYMDYLIGDRTVIPPGNFIHYSEKILYLAHSYLPNDSTRTVSEHPPSREAAGLPATGFVYCCFNNSYKITPAVFDGWMRILKRTPAAVLWLARTDAIAAENLRREAVGRGVNPERLIFATRVPSLADHLARQRLADLFLDTLPYNAHATAIDALWAGLPVLTRLGEGFAGRVAASLLKSIGLPELITSTPQEYEEMAVELAHDPGRLAAIKHKLAEHRLTTPLFDTRTFTRHLESAYQRIDARQRAGLAPDHFID